MPILSTSSSTHSIGSTTQGDEQQYLSRYYLHHHPPNHHSRHFNAFRQNKSSTALQQIKRHRSHTTFDLDEKTNTNLSRTHSSHPEMNRTMGHEIILKGHVFVMATCSRCRDLCESCRHTVHSHGYYYCKNCPSVIHAKRSCEKELKRNCPFLEINIEGWGEGQQNIRFMEPSTLDMESVFLSGMPGLQINRCFECGETMDPHGVRILASDHGPKVDDASHQHRGSRIITIRTRKIGHLKEESKHKTHTHNHSHNSQSRAGNSTEIRICHYTGKYYCDHCHWNDNWYVPGSIFLLNDVSKQPVSRSAYLKLRVLWDSGVYQIPDYWHKENSEANRVFELRSRLNRLMRYTFICQIAGSLKENLEVAEPTHLLGNPKFLRLCDVMDILNGTLYPRLETCEKILSEHVDKCSTCAQLTVPSDFGEPIWLGQNPLN